MPRKYCSRGSLLAGRRNKQFETKRPPAQLDLIREINSIYLVFLQSIFTSSFRGSGQINGYYTDFLLFWRIHFKSLGLFVAKRADGFEIANFCIRFCLRKISRVSGEMRVRRIR